MTLFYKECRYVNNSQNRWNGDKENVFWSVLYLLFNPFPKKTLVFMYLQYKSFENTKGKGEIARNEQFLLFPVFSTGLENFMPFSSNLKLLSANSSNLDESNICRLGKG